MIFLCISLYINHFQRVSDKSAHNKETYRICFSFSINTSILFCEIFLIKITKLQINFTSNRSYSSISRQESKWRTAIHFQFREFHLNESKYFTVNMRTASQSVHFINFVKITLSTSYHFQVNGFLQNMQAGTETRDEYNISVAKSQENRSLWWCQRRWEENRKMAVRDMLCDDTDWIYLGQDRDQQRALVNMHFRFP
jgi:hypothetical protein